jgi:tryptophan halogenase
LLGLRLEPQAHHEFARLMRPDQLRGALASVARNIDDAVAALPQHQAFLDAYCGAAR